MGRPRKSSGQLAAAGAKPGRVAARRAEELAAGITVPAAPPPVPLPAAPDTFDAARRYAEDVLAGRVVAGSLVKRGCTRFFDDLQRTDITFDAAAVQRVGDYAASLDLDLLPWECFILANLFGFKKADGARRYSLAYISMGRKNGKSTLMALIILYMADPEGDGEPSADCFIAATSRYQSRDIVFRSALKFRNDSENLTARTTAFKTSLVFERSGRIEPLAANPERLAGLNIHCGVLDELGDHPSGDLYNIFRTSTANRRQPLTVSITTAGAYREGNIAWATQQHALQVLDGTITDDGFFPFICTPDEGDNWEAVETWKKANPSYGTLINAAQLAQLHTEAKSIRSAKLAFLRFNLNLWPSTTLSSWLDADDLTKRGVGYLNDAERHLSVPERLARAEERLHNRSCILGFDCALVNDLTALAILFPPTDPAGIFEVLFRVWCPETDIHHRSREHRVPYEAWRDEGYIIMTPEDCTNFPIVENDICELRNKFTVREMGFDINLARDLVGRIQARGMRVTQIRQGFGLHPAIQRIEKLIREGRLCMHGHPVANWCFANVTLSHGVRETRFDKSKSREKIDLAVAVACAMDVFMAEPQSVYSGRGIVSI
jgi:phage terminase large subunit-like protein